MSKLEELLNEVNRERLHQNVLWGAEHDRNHSWPDWHHLMSLRLRLVEPARGIERRRALIELASLAIAAIEANE